MKVCIVTVYNSINSGSFWQAKALGDSLKKMGHDVYYLKRKNTISASSSTTSKFVKIIKIFLKYGWKEAQNQFKIFKEFELCQREFKIIKNTKEKIKNIDCFILGSDTIWNLNSKYFSKNYETYFGGDFKEKTVISYAASVANTSYEKIIKYEKIPKLLDNIKNISVRDNYTKKLIQSLTSNKVELVCDPTLLLNKNDYKEMVTETIKGKYLFLYLFESPTKSQIDDIKKFANQKGLKIISGVESLDFSDENIKNSPKEFLNYMFNAEYIITDTFHGMIFSINLEKDFIVLDRNKNKVNDFLKLVKFDDRLIKKEGNNIYILEDKIDYNIRKKDLNDLISKSKTFLKNTIIKNNREV